LRFAFIIPHPSVRVFTAPTIRSTLTPGKQCAFAPVRVRIFHLRDNCTMAFQAPVSATSRFRIDWRLATLIVLAAAYAAPLGWNAYERLVEVGLDARKRLIEQHQLWEIEPGYRNNPRMYTRMAAQLLNDTQLMRRIHTKYGPLAADIELDYRRDLAVTRALIVLKALAYWGAPVGGLYLALRFWRRRKPAPVPKAKPASVLDPRYRPQEPGDKLSG
jgi:hypothetical protein